MCSFHEKATTEWIAQRWKSDTQDEAWFNLRRQVDFVLEIPAMACGFSDLNGIARFQQIPEKKGM